MKDEIKEEKGEEEEEEEKEKEDTRERGKEEVRIILSFMIQCIHYQVRVTCISYT